MKSYARWLFGTSVIFNIAVALDVLILRHWFVTPFLPLDPIHGTNLVSAVFTGLLVGMFGIVYACIAFDPVRFRLYIPLGVAGKLLAVASTTVPWLLGAVPWNVPALTGLDLIYALLFFDYLRRTRTG
jgi:hypothetical protein